MLPEHAVAQDPRDINENARGMRAGRDAVCDSEANRNGHSWSCRYVLENPIGLRGCRRRIHPGGGRGPGVWLSSGRKANLELAFCKTNPIAAAQHIVDPRLGAGLTPLAAPGGLNQRATFCATSLPIGVVNNGPFKGQAITSEALVTGSEVQRWGVGVVQDLDAVSVGNSGIPDGRRLTTSFEDLDIFQVGGVIFF
jgi:hypothetical protein